MENENKLLMGYCPKCGAPGKERERRPNGNDTCERGCVYPSRDALLKPQSTNVTFSEDEDEDAFAAESDDEILDLLGR
jgi:hypothetical protein